MTDRNDDNIAVTKTDGWKNIYTREGVAGADKATGFSHGRGPIMREVELRGIYRTDGFGKKLVNRPTDDMIREWFNITNDTDGKINKVLRELCAPRELRTALRWAKVFGGSIVIMGIDDGGDLQEPVNEADITKVEFLKVYDRFRVTWETNDLFDDPNEAGFGTPEIYTIHPVESVPTTSFKVHVSRILRFDGELTDDKTKLENSSWDDSIYTGVRTELINLNSSYLAVKSIIDEYVMTIIKIENLQQMIAAGNDQLVKDRMNIIDLGRHTINSVILDAKEDYDKSSSSTAGLNKLLQEFQVALAAVTDIPLVILMGVSPGGQNATGDADIRLYYDAINSAQDDKMLEPLTKLINYVMLSSEGPFNGIPLPEWSIQFKPLWQPTAQETSETRFKNAEADEKYILNNVLNPLEVRESRFGGDSYSSETKLDKKFDTELSQITELNSPSNNPDDKGKNNDNRNDFALVSFGPSEVAKDHTHEIFFDKDTGMGFTGPGGESDHVHRIENFSIQPRQDLDGTEHLHIISKDKLERLFNGT